MNRTRTVLFNIGFSTILLGSQILMASQNPMERNCKWEVRKDTAGNCHLTTDWFTGDENNKIKFKLDFKNFKHANTSNVRAKIQNNYGFTFTVSNIKAIAGFDPDFFEGPDAPGQKHKLLSLTAISNNSKGKSFFIAPSGSYTTCDDEKELAFQFEASYADKRANFSIDTVLRSLVSGSSHFSVELISPDKSCKKPIISVKLETKEMHSALEQFLRGCSPEISKK